MTLEEINVASSEEIEERISQIGEEIKTAEADVLTELNDELDLIEERKKILVEEKAEEIETRRKALEDVTNGKGKEIKQKEERHIMTIEEIRSSGAYLDAFANYIKHNDDTELRAMLTEEGGGTYPVPTMVENVINTAWENDGEILALATHMNYKGILRVPFEISATDAAYHTEGADAPAEEQIVLGTVGLYPAMIKKWITVSDETLSMDSGSFLTYLYKEIAHKIVSFLEDQIVKTIYEGSLSSETDVPKVVTTNVQSFSATTVFSALSLLSAEAKNPVIIMSKSAYYNEFMSLTDTTGRPIYNVVPENGKPTYYLNGNRVYFSDSELLGTRIIVGDMSAFMLNFPNGNSVQMVTDPYSLAEKDLVKFVGKLFVGMAVTASNRFVIVTKA